MGEYKDLEKKIKMKRKNSWENLKDGERKKVFSFSEEYKNFLKEVKTERENVDKVVQMAEEEGFKPLSELKDGHNKYYAVNHNKNLALIVLGKEEIKNGFNLIASHVDVPHIDIKMNPIYESEEMAMMKTHYYGGIKKYHWVSRPLELHGVIIKNDGEKVELTYGSEEDEGVFVIPDVLPHLSRKVQKKEKLLRSFEGEKLHAIAGSIPIDDEDIKEKIKFNVLKVLNEKYDIVEEDFVSAELKLVPAGEPRFVGFDKSILGSFGHDDRICGYTSSKAIFDIENPKKTSINFLADKEEIGSEGRTGMQSWFFLEIVGELLQHQEGSYSDLKLKKMLRKSNVISSDVGAAVNPLFKNVHDNQNAPKFGGGISLVKYTGARGKAAANDADAEFVGRVRRLWNENNIDWQIGTLGKVDEGGGGTVAKFLAKYNMNVVDAGTPLLSMHSPFELASNVDIYSTYKAYKVFFEKME
ncbi:MAG: aminopeptidase [Candidatus Mcinerneyibacterium aminivorans]|uniref:M18 family aminopeptidase n=1 Tax=Candidatus Mcinerneyibacterium aminivorans TaxID=2703815 RepID=A0A5D0MI10_9BACT|nr:MAG: aminopeptidase [Candidatus Mcinerneyibacterium aminivorans]